MKIMGDECEGVGHYVFFSGGGPGTCSTDGPCTHACNAAAVAVDPGRWHYNKRRASKMKGK